MKMKIIGEKLVTMTLESIDGQCAALVDGAVGAYELRHGSGWELWRGGRLIECFNASTVEQIDGGILKFGKYKERVNAFVVQTVRKGEWLMLGDCRLLPVAVAEKLGWVEGRRETLTLIPGGEPKGDHSIRVSNATLYYDYTEDGGASLNDDQCPVSPQLCALMAGFQFAEVRWHGVEVVCGHDATVIEEDDATGIQCTDGAADLCNDCFGKVCGRNELWLPGNEDSDWVFKGTKAELAKEVGANG